MWATTSYGFYLFVDDAGDEGLVVIPDRRTSPVDLLAVAIG